MATTIKGVPNLPLEPACKCCENYPMVHCQHTNNMAIYWCASCGALAKFVRDWPDENDADPPPVSYTENWTRPSKYPVELPK